MSGALNVFPGCRWMALLVQSCGNARRRAAHEPFTRPKKDNMPFLILNKASMLMTGHMKKHSFIVFQNSKGHGSSGKHDLFNRD